MPMNCSGNTFTSLDLVGSHGKTKQKKQKRIVTENVAVLKKSYVNPTFNTTSKA